MEKYRLVEEHKGDGDEFLEEFTSSEVRITQQGKPRNYISYAMSLFVSAILVEQCHAAMLLSRHNILTHLTTVGRIQHYINQSHGPSHQQGCHNSGDFETKNAPASGYLSY